MSSLSHHGIKGQKWGVRRYQNKDGTLTAAGQKRKRHLIEVGSGKRKRIVEAAKPIGISGDYSRDVIGLNRRGIHGRVINEDDNTHIIKKGTILYRTAANPELNDDGTYASLTKNDADRYIDFGRYGDLPGANGIKLDAMKMFEFSANRDLKIANGKHITEIITDDVKRKMKNGDADQVKFGRDVLESFKRHEEDLNLSFSISEMKRSKEAYSRTEKEKEFDRDLVGKAADRLSLYDKKMLDYASGKDYRVIRDRLKREGYDGFIDIEDVATIENLVRGGASTEYPVVILNANDVLTLKRSVKESEIQRRLKRGTKFNSSRGELTNVIQHTSIGGTMYIEGNALILGDSSYLEHHGIRGQRWGVRRFQNRDGSLTNAGRKRLGYATKGAAQTVSKAFKAGVKAGGNAVKAVKAHHEKKEAEKLQKKKEKASKTRAGVYANKDLFTSKELKELNAKFEEQDKLTMARIKHGVEIAKSVGEVAKSAGEVGKAYEALTGHKLVPDIMALQNGGNSNSNNNNNNNNNPPNNPPNGGGNNNNNNPPGNNNPQGNNGSGNKPNWTNTPPNLPTPPKGSGLAGLKKGLNLGKPKFGGKQDSDLQSQMEAAKKQASKAMKNAKLQEYIDAYNQDQNSEKNKELTARGQKAIEILSKGGGFTSDSLKPPTPPTPKPAPSSNNLMAQIRSAQAKLEKPNKNETPQEHREAQKKADQLESLAKKYNAQINKPGADPADVTEKLLKQNKELLNSIKHMDFSDDIYLEHYGVRGMKWGKHLMAGKGGGIYDGTALGGGGGGGPMTEEERKKLEALKKFYKKRYKSDRERQKWQNSTSGKYHHMMRHYEIQNGVLFVDSSAYLSHHGVKGQKWGVRRFQNSDGSLTPKGRKHYEKKIEKLKRKQTNSDSRRGELERKHPFAVAGSAILGGTAGAAGAAVVAAMGAVTIVSTPVVIAAGAAAVAAISAGVTHTGYSINEAWEGRGTRIRKKKIAKYEKMLKQSDMEEGMYNVENGTLFIDAGEPYLEHHGVLGMKWGKHLRVGKGPADAPASAGGGGGEDDEKLKEMAKKAGMSVAEYKQKFASKIGGAASKVGEKVYDAAGGSHKKNAEGWRKMAREESNAARASEKSAHENSARAASQDRKYGSGGDVYRRAAESDNENAKTHHSNAKARSERAASEQAAYEKSLAGKYDKMKADHERKTKMKRRKMIEDAFRGSDNKSAKRISVKDRHLVINGSRSGSQGLEVGETGEKPKSFKEKAYNALGGKYKNQAAEAHKEMVQKRNDAERESRLSEASYRKAAALGKQASSETSTSSRPRARKKKHTSGGSGVTVRRPGRKPVARTKRVTQSSTGVKRRGATGTGARVRRGA